MRIFAPPLLFAVVILLSVPVQAANVVEFEVFKDRDGGGFIYGSEVFVEMPSATNVQWWTGSSWQDFDTDPGSDHFWMDDDYASLVELNNAIVGSAKMRVHTSAGYATYAFTLGTVTESMFPVVPTITPTPFPSSVPQRYTFTWTWGGNTGDVDELVVEAWVDPGGPPAWYEAEYTEGQIALNATQWTPGIAETGQASFFVGYSARQDAMLTGWAYIGGESTTGAVFDFAGDDERLVYAGAGDERDGFNVVPEPTTLSLLALSGLAVVTRRRKT